MRFKNHEKGIIGRKHSMLRYDVQIPGRPYPWDGVGCLNPQHFERGEVVTIGFVGKNRQLPVILNQKPFQMSTRILAEAAVLPIIGSWVRRAARTLGRYWAGWQEGWPVRVVGSAIQSEDDWLTGSIVRVYESTQMSAQDATLTDNDLAAITSTSSEQFGNILAGAWDTEQRYLLVESDFDPENTYSAGFEQGNVAGYEGEASEIPPYDIAQADYAADPNPETGFNPFNGYPYPSSPGGSFDPPKGDEWNSGWVDGHLTGWITAYSEGWVAAGGTLP